MISKLVYTTEEGDKLEILRESHIAFREAGKEEAFFEWEEVPSIHEVLDHILEQGKNMFLQVKELLESRFGEAIER